MQHCVTLFKKKQEENLFRVYVTDALKVLTSNTAKIVNGGAYMQIRYADIIGDPKQSKEERTEEDIKNHIISKLKDLKQ